MQRVGLHSHIRFAVLAGVVLLSLLGCSAEKRYRVLSFFFDGVPAPGGGTRSGEAGGKRVVYSHRPYAEGKCGSCHPSDQIDMSIGQPTSITALSSDTCLKCHEKAPREFAVMHGPVAAVQCLLCHTPHESAAPHLLTSFPPRVCVQCHAPETMLPKRPEHADEKADCLTCHVGHGGTSHGLLRAAAAAATQPSVSSLAPADGRAGL